MKIITVNEKYNQEVCVQINEIFKDSPSNREKIKGQTDMHANVIYTAAYTL